MRNILANRGFLSLITTQFLGAANDNILKIVLTFMVINGVWSGQLGEGGQGLVGVCFTVPFILFSGYAGQFADRHSKRTVSLLVKMAEIPIALVAMLGFWTANLWITLLALLALTTQSAFFGPAKYGMIPELVEERDLSRANGTINMMTNIAVIVGTLVGGFVSNAYYLPDADTTGWVWLPGTVLTAIAVAGLVAVMFLDKLQPGDKDLRYDLNPFGTYIDSIAQMAKTRLLMVMLAWGYFYLLAGLALFILPEYTDVLGVDYAEASVLMGVMGVAIGLGSAAAGLISGHRIEPRLIPVGAAGLTVFFVLLGVVPPSMPDLPPMRRVALSNVSFFVFGAGFFAGFYIIPLQALLQKLSPQDERGRFLGTANGVSFVFLTVAALLYWAIRPLFGDRPQAIFLVSALLMAAGSAFFLWRLRGTGLVIGRKRHEELGTESEATP